MNKALDELRKEIDSADEELVNALAKRMDLVRKVGKLKKRQDILPLDETRWRKVINMVTKKAEGKNIPEKLIEKIYEEIHQAALTIEKNE